MNYIEINKFSRFNNKHIIFVKTDFLITEFRRIAKLNFNVILITGNSDIGIGYDLYDMKPKNVKFWFAQNLLIYENDIFPIPIGIENQFRCGTLGFGKRYFLRSLYKKILFNLYFMKTSTSNILVNFNISTNYKHRKEVLEFVERQKVGFTIINGVYGLHAYFREIKKHKMVLCPSGNGIDTHRLWEVLYLGRIPITIRVGDYRIYDLYNQFPIIILDNIEQLDNRILLEEEYNKALLKIQRDKLKFDFWRNLVLENSFFL